MERKDDGYRNQLFKEMWKGDDGGRKIEEGEME
jgi:hypothetical protein